MTERTCVERRSNEAKSLVPMVDGRAADTSRRPSSCRDAGADDVSVRCRLIELSIEISDKDDHRHRRRSPPVHRDSNKYHFEYSFERSADANDGDDELEEDTRSTSAPRNDNSVNNNAHRATSPDNQRESNTHVPMAEPVDTVDTAPNDRNRDETISSIDAFLLLFFTFNYNK